MTTPNRSIIVAAVVGILVAITFIAAHYFVNGENRSAGLDRAEQDRSLLRADHDQSRGAEVAARGVTTAPAPAGRSDSIDSPTARATPRGSQIERGAQAMSNAREVEIRSPAVTTRADTPRSAPTEPAEPPAGDEESPALGELVLAGRVLSEAGQPVGGLRVQLESMHGKPKRTLTMFSDQRGFFQFTKLSPGDYRLFTDKTRHYSAATVYAQAGLRSVDIIVQRLLMLTLQGVVTDYSGAPLTNVDVTGPHPTPPARTNAAGQYRIRVEGKQGQGLALQFKAEGFVDDVVFFDAVDLKSVAEITKDMRLRALGDGKYSGRVVDEALNPLRGVLVQINSASLNANQHTLTREDGSFQIDGVRPADDYTVKVSAAGQLDTWTERGVSIFGEVQATDIILASLAVGRVSGAIVDVEGKAIGGFSLLAVSSGANGRSVTLVSDSVGQFTVESLASGELSFLSRSVPNVQIEGAFLNADEDLFLTLVVDWGDYAVTGQVLDNRGIPLPGADVVMTWRGTHQGLQSRVTRPTTSDDRGYFRFTQLGPGVREIIVRGNGAGSRRIDVDPRQSQHLIQIHL